MIDKILEYTNRGWYVFPCNIAKEPLTSDGFKSATKEKSIIEAWWQDYPTASVGIDVIRSGLLVVDIDPRNGGDNSFAQWVQEYGDVPITVTVNTGGGGKHYYFKADPELLHSSKPIPGIDIKANGYVIAPPSGHESGNCYEFTPMLSPDDVDVAPVPAWLKTLLLKNNLKRDKFSLPEKITNGNRNNTLTSFAGKLRHDGMGREEIYGALQIANQRCDKPLPEREVALIADSVSRYSVVDNEPKTELWVSQKFLALTQADIKFCDALGGWFIWNGNYWEKDNSFNIKAKVIDFLKASQLKAKEESQPDLVKLFVKYENNNKINALLNMAKDRAISKSSDDFDKHGRMLNCNNGIVDLETGRLHEHNRDMLMTKIVPHDYNPEAECPNWLKFLSEIFDNDLDVINFVHKALGYACSSDIDEQCLFMLYGTGANGKSTMLKHIFKLLGSYALSTPSSTLTEKSNDGASNDIAALKGARFITSSESGKQKRMAETTIKYLTGDDPITARFLYHENFTYFATFKIFFATNYKPEISGTDDGIWRRIRQIPFERSFSLEERDLDLDRKLSLEYEGILNWLVLGYQLFRKERLKVCYKMKTAVDSYKTDMDVIGTFLSECCDLSDSEYVTMSSDFQNALNQWVKENNYRRHNRTMVLDYLKSRGFARYRDPRGVLWKGIKLKFYGNNSFGEHEQSDDKL